MKKGVPMGVVSIVTRYNHSLVKVLDLNDINSYVDLIIKFIENLI